MLRTSWTACFLLLALAGCSPPAEPPATSGPPDSAETPEPEPVEPPPPRPEVPAEGSAAEIRFSPFDTGMEVFDGDVAGTRFLLIRVDPRRQPIDLFADQDRSHPGRGTDYVLKASGARAVLSGGFLETYSPAIPLGFVQVDGIVLNREAGTGFFNGAIRLDQGRVDVIHLEDRADLEERAGQRRYVSRDAARQVQQTPSEGTDYLQSGPLIVLDGAPALHLADPKEYSRIEGDYGRAFFCVDTEGRAVLGATGPIRLDALAPLLARAGAEGGAGCRAAVNLSGASSRSIIGVGERGIVSFGETGFRNATAIVVGARRLSR